jgi:hypothetical protein
MSKAKGDALRARLRHHVTGAIERGEAQPVAEQRGPVLEVRNPRAHETMRGLYWAGVLYADGVPVCRFEDRADGGCLVLEWRPGLDSGPIEDALRAMMPGETIEPVEQAIGRLWDAALLRGPKA